MVNLSRPGTKEAAISDISKLTFLSLSDEDERTISVIVALFPRVLIGSSTSSFFERSKLTKGISNHCHYFD
jgi:uncharacterized membrane protein